MFSLLKKTFTKKAAIAALLPFLLAGLSFISCSNPTGSDVGVPTALVGTWVSDGGDGYTITVHNKLSYSMSDGEEAFAGTIIYISQFTDTSGVIIIKYDKGHEQKYYADYDPDPPYAGIGEPLPLKGNYLGIYYDSLEPGVSVEMASAYSPGGAEQGSAFDAIKVFTAGNKDNYIFYEPTYDWQSE